jgi:hypothetical protein
VATTRRHYKDTVYETHLLRRSYREDGRVKTETLGNLSHLPGGTIELIRRSLMGETFVPAGTTKPLDTNGLVITRSLPHGDAAVAAAMATRLGLVELIGPACRHRDLVVALVLARVCHPGSKLAATRWWADSTVGADLGVSGASTDEVYAALDWLLARQPVIEAALAARHLAAGGRVLFDLSSSWMEGSACPLVARGHSRDGKRGKPQIEYGIIADPQGCPVAVHVFPGNTGDPTAFVAAVESVRTRFGLDYNPTRPRDEPSTNYKPWATPSPWTAPANPSLCPSRESSTQPRGQDHARAGARPRAPSLPRPGRVRSVGGQHGGAQPAGNRRSGSSPNESMIQSAVSTTAGSSAHRYPHGPRRISTVRKPAACAGRTSLSR